MAASGWKRPSILKAFKTNKRRNTNFSVSLEKHNSVRTLQRSSNDDDVDDETMMETEISNDVSGDEMR